MSIPNKIKESRKFIEAYKSYVCLWNSSDDRYKDENLRNNAHADLLKIYKEIEPDATIEQMKKKIDQREMKNVLEREKTEAGDDETSLWYLHDSQYLQDLETPLKTTSSIMEQTIFDECDYCKRWASSLMESTLKTASEHTNSPTVSSYIEDISGRSTQLPIADTAVSAPHFVPTPEPSPESSAVAGPPPLMYFVDIPQLEIIVINTTYNNIAELIQDKQYS